MHEATTLRTHQMAAAVWNTMLRSSGFGLLFLLAAAYFTGDEYQHTHMMIGYGIAMVIAANLYWELVHPHQLHVRGTHAPAASFSAVLQGALIGDTPGFAALTVLSLVAILAGVAMILMTVTHLWAVPMVDEMHEVVAYFTLGLVVLHVAVVLIGSANYLERRVARVLRRR
jgi:hypothetical protein